MGQCAARLRTQMSAPTHQATLRQGHAATEKANMAINQIS
ncbi:hypothetical protein BLL52_0643 [Rhodoferax antarcticus ANT.BR]|uniref:Uncharacterized protein n=1 Tax=Rhodoferax antarcticus ANT.BR TaxID=1111071 RepID=A0A1Q8YJ55_9BURK|nr:hypothetical protein BLL52_0643 [Rhodoferax antarcticus ANT.BR]